MGPELPEQLHFQLNQYSNMSDLMFASKREREGGGGVAGREVNWRRGLQSWTRPSEFNEPAVAQGRDEALEAMQLQSPPSVCRAFPRD